MIKSSNKSMRTTPKVCRYPHNPGLNTRFNFLVNILVRENLGNFQWSSLNEYIALELIIFVVWISKNVSA